MALDGAFLCTIRKEIEDRALGSRIDRIYQPSREEICLLLRSKGWSGKLLLSAAADSPRIHFTTQEIENPKSPPMFCRLLRKHLSGAKLTAVRQLGMDRVIYLDFDTRNEFGDPVTVTVAIEIMSRYSNIIIIDGDGKVLDSIKRVDPEMSRVRTVLPGVSYQAPPAQGKLNLLTAVPEQTKGAVLAAKGVDLSKAMLAAFEGFSPTLARELTFDICGNTELNKLEMTDEQWALLDSRLYALKSGLETGENDYCILCEESGRPKEFSFVQLGQYGSLYTVRSFASPSALLDAFYSERVRMERMKQRSSDLLKLLNTHSDRLTRKIALQKEELAQCAERDALKEKGDLLSSYIYLVKKGDKEVTVQDFYHDNTDLTISLDPALTPVQNVQKYYKEYRKAATAEKLLIGFIDEAEKELTYLDSVYDAVSRTSGESELLEIRQELSEQGYLKRYSAKNSKFVKAQPPLRYRSSDGYLILCGRNNKQNDKLTLKEARPDDIWFHTKDFPGSHVILVTDGTPLDDIPIRTVEEAAMIAAYNSRARSAALVPVQYIQARQVRKPGGAKPGMVIFDHYFVLYITPDEEKVNGMLESR